MNQEPEWLTVAEAAKRLGLAERTLYRLLKADNYAARTLSEHRQTLTGRRLTTLLPPDLLADLKAAQGHREATGNVNQAGANNVADNAAKTPSNADNNAAKNADNAAGTVSEEPPPGTLPTVLYQKIIADKDAEIEYLRGALRLAQENLSREQTLRALPSPMNALAPNVPAPSFGGTTANDVPQNDVGEAQASAGGAGRGMEPERAAKGSWWARLWRQNE